MIAQIVTGLRHDLPFVSHTLVEMSPGFPMTNETSWLGRVAIQFETFRVMHGVHTLHRTASEMGYRGFVSARAFCLHGWIGVMQPDCHCSPIRHYPASNLIIVNVLSATFPIGVIPKATLAFFAKGSIEAGLFRHASSESPVPAPKPDPHDICWKTPQYR